jgi:hypothetical protein
VSFAIRCRSISPTFPTLDGRQLEIPTDDN